MNKLLTIGLLTVTINSFCQNQVIPYSDLLREIYESTKDSIFYENATFKDDIGIDEKSFLGYLNTLKTTKDAKGYFLVDKGIILSGCVFESDFCLFRTSFSKRVYFNENIFPNKAPGTHRLDNSAYLTLDSCLFNKELLIVSLNKSFPVFNLKVASCKINHAFWYLEMSSVEINRSDFTERFKLNAENNSSVNIDSTSLFLDSNYESKIRNYQGGFTELASCVIKGDENMVFQIESSSGATVIENNTFNTNVQITIDQSAITMSGNAFNQKLGLDLSKIDESVFMDMRSLKDLDFGLYLEKQDFPKVWQYYDGSTHENITDEKTFKRYFRIYKTLYDYFRLIGDIQSANKAYVKIRELEGRVIKFEYVSNPSFKNYFSLALNRLLKSYTAYGTDPARAILISFYIILLFGVFYFFFPSDWDVTSKSLLIGKFKEFIEKNDKGYVKPFLQLVLGFMVSFINAATLSLNAFTTLGFGNIPTHGIARYVCVMQGFIGWFLLSIFTVALINQAQF